MIACPCAVCASADPRDARLRASVLVEFYAGEAPAAEASGPEEAVLRLLIDAGPDFRQQMLRARVRHLDAILLTHEHMDHIGGLDDVRAFNYFCQEPAEIYALPRVLEAVQKEFAYAFTPVKYPGAPEMKLHPVGEGAFELQGAAAAAVPVVPVHALHGRLPILGYRVGALGYLTDASQIAPEEVAKFKGVKVFVINAIRKKPHITHFSLAQALDVAREVGAERTLLTHLSHQMPAHAALTEELAGEEGLSVAPAYDGLSFWI